MFDLLSRFSNLNPRHWPKYIFVIGVLFLSAVLPMLSLKDDLFLLLILIAITGLIGVLIILYQPELGFILIIIGGAFIPFQGPGGVNSTVLIVFFLFGIWLFRLLTKTISTTYIPSQITLPVLCFFVVAMIAFGTGQMPWFSFAGQAPMDAQIGGMMIYVLSLIAFVLMANLVRDLQWLEWITWTYIATGAIYIVLGRLIFQVGLNSRLVEDLFSDGYKGSVFWVWFAVLTFSQAIFNQRLHNLWRIAIGGLTIATLYSGYFQAGGWKSGWIPPLAAVVTLIVLRWRKILFLAPLALIPGLNIMRQVIAEDQYSFSTRLEAWAILTEITKVNPILGLGFANYYWYTPLFPIRGFAVRFNSHNQYVDIIAQMGFIGLFVFLWIFWELGKLGWSLRKHVPEGFAKAYVYATLGGLVGMLIAGLLGDWVMPFVYNVGMLGMRSSIIGWMFLGGLVSLNSMVTLERSMTPDASFS